MASIAISGCGPKLGDGFTQPSIPTGKALIYIYRPFGGFGYLHPIHIYSENTLIVTMPHKSYYPYTVNPGEVEFNSRAGLLSTIQESVTINARAGQVYYLKTILRPISRTTRLKSDQKYQMQASLEVMPFGDGSDEIKECKLILELHDNNAKKP